MRRIRERTSYMEVMEELRENGRNESDEKRKVEVVMEREKGG